MQGLDDSLRRYGRRISQSYERKLTMTTAASGEKVLLGRPSGASSSPHCHTCQPCCYHYHLKHKPCLARNASIGPSAGPKLPQLPLSLSELGFLDFEFEIALDCLPRNVILSESERHMILQQRQQKLQESQCQNSKRKPNFSHSK
jgi:hypothetical protein